MAKSIEDLQAKLRKFADDRDWNQFHSPKNLSMALSAEVGELLEHFQWLTEEESYLTDNDAVKKLVSEEIADIFLYLLRLSDKLGVDIMDYASKKIQINDGKYPIELCKGKSTKYVHLK